MHQIEEYEEVGREGGREEFGWRQWTRWREREKGGGRRGEEERRRGEVGLFSMVSKPRSNCAYRSVLLSRQRSHCPLPLLR